LARDDLIEFEGKVTEVLAGGNFTVELDNSHKVLARLSGRMRRFHIRVVIGDRVTVGVSPYDPSKGFITFRA
jgi:translation initiation factor IF-1